MTLSELFWTIATDDLVPLMVPCLVIGIVFYLIADLVHFMCRGR